MVNKNIGNAKVISFYSIWRERKIQNKEFSRDDVFVGNSFTACSRIILRKTISSNN
ncbi:hypothetical protein protein [Bacillus cereus G9241]|nr:hypothetical protein protein [Bacillus cereus G9241]